jgi:hypothetical protein
MFDHVLLPSGAKSVTHPDGIRPMRGQNLPMVAFAADNGGKALRLLMNLGKQTRATSHLGPS